MSVIEIARVALASGATHEQFIEQNRVLEAGYIVKQPGFLSRELASGEGGGYVVVVHWRTAADADASMSRFATDPNTQGFMSVIDAATMSMDRYQTVALDGG
ncbi:hypothetical protein [Streptomyces sp. TBY4]|uniref:hypothetical protein n=1 Tax=Streptomyces sp. TBY4 TaxID=2962030 RepID=UPI0020B89C2C|nr:hypothetical protein [Streptomyces sp. TBY4]MCP3756993.1 hypothetical protein [Streptomyces sp. TBY4]